jgi:RNA polymerase sigma-70 factor, ECF subfamily
LKGGTPLTADKDVSVAPDAVADALVVARGGSPDALGRLLELCRAYLLAVANRELGSALQPKGGASDMVQEAFLEAHRIFGRFHGQSLDELLAWMRAILLNKLADFERHYQGTDKRRIDREVAWEAAGAPAGLLAAAGPSPSGAAAEDEEARRLRAALEQLPPHYRQVLVWRQWEDLPFEEIARRLDRTVDAARMIWWRAVERLQRELGPPD